MGAYFHKHADKDPLCGFFRWGSRLFPITNSHICIVDGYLEPDLLRRALNMVIPKFESLHELRSERVGARGEGELFKIATTRRAIEFDTADFRRELMDFVARSEPRGLVDYPLKLHVMYAEDKRRTCVHLGISHDLGDVKSGNILFARLMEEYKRLEPDIGGTGLPGAGENDANDLAIAYPHLPLTRLKPNWYTGGAAIRRKARAYLEIAKRMSTRRRTCVVAVPGHTGAAGKVAGSGEFKDFFHQALPEDLQSAIPEAAKRRGTTVNTLFSAALVRYIAAHQRGANSTAVYTIAVSLRKLLGNAYNEAFRSFMIDCTLRIDPDPDALQLLRGIDAEIEAIRRGRLEIELGRMENAISLFHPPLLPRAWVYWIMKRTQGTNILYSNPGIIDEAFDTFGPDGLPIGGFTTFGCLVPPYDLMFLTPTMGGRLHLTVVYRGKLFPDIREQFVAPFLKELERILTEIR